VVSIAALVSALLACTTGTPYREVAAQLSTPPAGLGRVVLYRTNASEVPEFRPNLTVDGQSVGTLGAGTFFAIDRPPGSHQVGVRPAPSLAAFGNEAAAAPVEVVLAPGETVYVQVEVLALAGAVQPALTLEDPADAQHELSHLDQVTPSPRP
jgi:hypothetical protein